MGEDEDKAKLAAKAKVLAEASGRSEEEVMADLLDDGILNESNVPHSHDHHHHHHHHNSSIREKAEILAEATGRTVEDILEDLEDDGILNESNLPDKNPSGKDLVEELKNAAALINVVKEINQDISDNTVLNGGQNKTEVKVESTLEGDIVDRAIASVERKAEKIRKIAIILAPIMLLLSGGIGFEYFLDDGGGGNTDYDEIWGCMDDNAFNYNSEANKDDGNCEYDPGDCDPDWRWIDVDIKDADNDGSGYNNDLEIRMVFEDWNECGHHMEGHFSIRIIYEESGEEWHEYQIDDTFHNEYTIDDEHWNLPAGEYVIRVDYHFHDSFWEGPSTLVNMEEEEDDCTPNIQSNGGSLVKIDANDPNDIRIRIEFGLYDDNACDPSEVDTVFDIFLDGQHQEGPIGQTETISGDMNNPTTSVFIFTPSEVASTPYGEWSVQCRWVPAEQSEQWCEDILGPLTIEEPQEPCDISVDNMAAYLDGGDSEQDAITISFFLAVVEETDCTDDVIVTYKLENGGNVLQHQVTTTMEDGEFEYTFDNVPVGSWHPIIRVDDENGYELDGDDVGDVEIEEPPRCDISLYEISFAHNGNDTAGVWYDLDCGDGGGDDGEGFNVSIQFDIKIHNTTEILDYNVTMHYIEGYVEDVHELLLYDITNGTYCFNWVAIWTDEEGQQHTITHTWENIVMNGTQGDD